MPSENAPHPRPVTRPLPAAAPPALCPAVQRPVPVRRPRPDTPVRVGALIALRYRCHELQRRIPAPTNARTRAPALAHRYCRSADTASAARERSPYPPNRLPTRCSACAHELPQRRTRSRPALESAGRTRARSHAHARTERTETPGRARSARRHRDMWKPNRTGPQQKDIRTCARARVNSRRQQPRNMR